MGTRAKTFTWNCLRCGKPFVGYLNQLFCGPECADKAQRKAAPAPTRCGYCGKPLDPPPEGKRGRKRHFCNRRCQLRARYASKIAGTVANSRN